MIFRSVCSGIEAASVAWSPLGWKADAFSEIEAFPSAVLAHHYPDVPNLGDMTKFREWPDATFDVLVGGTPCQSFSVAGLRKGLADPRGNLALVYLGILDRFRPTWMVWENVPGVLSSNDGKDFGAFLGGLGELGYGFAYRVLDAQFFGLAQRRKRVFVVGHLGDWRRAAAVLFERESLSGNPAPRRKAGKEFTYAAAPCLTSSGRGVERSGDTRGQDPLVAVEVAPTLRAGGNTTGGDRPYGTDVDTCDSLIAFGGNNQSGPIDVATAQTAHGGTGRIDFESETFVCFDETQITSAENRCNPQPSDPSHPLAKGARPPTIASFTVSQNADGFAWESEISPTLQAARECASSNQFSGVREGWRVRRLTPTECERLQGFRDGYTAIPYRGKPAADGPRYKSLGNSMATNVMRWIGERIAAVDQMRRAA